MSTQMHVTLSAATRRFRRSLRISACLVLLAWAALAPGDAVRSTCEAQPGRKCGCPMMPGERVLIECRSVDPDLCGACAVVTPGGQREGRPCVTIN